ncbi:class I histocompatibility antigen, F10 alpha chain isoform X1 [Syngnathus scovelli]|uniref:class I histocompatibility antigen, F10 alpha chain isoform X1 n=1 Tax=Syngnathus scovelli TaxID=161590 RepID=UPI0021100BFF|nr:class I histocompatibility antigen, F10 alpha chain isoform X2 [Syngnathus scovelli]XP_049594638.1 class I histocompatibility antigen, F10 alpha chain isoform X3 [Syngnathus scovelli]XP_049594676.1 class I histocompatibility antigen, F10 alpha chain isoform X6 [Syngnathus scovelli]XP_049594707.1 class I histocompatibility antigen, F10 alpha chain isoform X12 [Syngnathus scovelli]
MFTMNILAFFVLAVQIYSVTPVIHTLNYFDTASQVAKLPEYWYAGYVDGVQIVHFDSNHRKAKAKQDWMDKITEGDPHYWETETAISIRAEQYFKVNIEIAKKRFNQTGGVHMLQVMEGCEWNDETGEVDGWQHYSYDGEDFISFELKTMSWIAAHPQAFITKLKWDQNDGLNQHNKNYFTEVCPSELKKHVSNGRDFLTRTELPRVSLLQKTPSSPITCHATGFYPRTSDLFWRKDGEQIHEDVEMGETLPNHDGTFQTTADLKVELTPAAEGRYECVFKLDGVREEMVTKLYAKSILSNVRIQEEEDRKKAVAIAVPLGVLALVAMAVAVGVFLAKRPKSQQANYAPASSTSSSEKD